MFSSIKFENRTFDVTHRKDDWRSLVTIKQILLNTNVNIRTISMDNTEENINFDQSNQQLY